MVIGDGTAVQRGTALDVLHYSQVDRLGHCKQGSQEISGIRQGNLKGRERGREGGRERERQREKFELVPKRKHNNRVFITDAQ